MGINHRHCIARRIWLLPVLLYRKLISPLIGPHCKYHPSCSAYMTEAVMRHGIFKGTYLGISRIMRCNGLYTGGYDPVPDSFSLSAEKAKRRAFRIKRR